MLHIILTILKVIGIILLCILGLLILIVTCILFVPIRYRADVSQKEDTCAMVRVHWLLHIISIKAVFRDRKLTYKCRVFGIPIRDSSRKPKEKQSGRKRKKNRKKTDDTPKNPDKTMAEAAGAEDQASIPITEGSPEAQERNQAGDPVSPGGSESAGTKTQKEHSHRSPFTVIRTILQKIQYTIRSIYDKIKTICHNIKRYVDILERKETAEAWKELVWALKRLLHHLRPRSLSGHVLYGMEDPATTGRILSYVCLLYPIYGDNLDVQADFEHKIFEAKIRMRGRIRVFTVARIALRLYRSRNVRQVLHWLNK